ncbi:polymorphic toxin-type HINT domain-containing protein [Streptomyces sp. NPDC056257]|uniref:polymorphic toxin-type HINT domain-containing protein n=1 Tax=Streptomyces sp. NPDC056257 TaxID=3345765 RepID=UPI0035DBD23F
MTERTRRPRETRPKQVTATITTPDDKDFTDLTLTDDANPRGSPATLTSTFHHPYWSETRHQWTDAGDLTPGEQLRQPNGTTLTVQTTRNYPYAVTTYNLTVDDFHTYYVLAGKTPVLVHNCGTQYYENRYGATDNRGLSATFEDGMVEMTLRARTPIGARIEGVPTGSEMFQEALDAFGGAENVRGITASWNTGDLDTNLNKFNELIRGGSSLEDAARGTWTGGQAGKRGWSSVFIDRDMSLPNADGTFQEVMVYFTR